MLEALTFIGAGAAVIAFGTGFQAVKATIDLTHLKAGTSDALRKVYQDVVDEPVPQDMLDTLRRLGDER